MYLPSRLCAWLLFGLLSICGEINAEWIWIEGENPSINEMHRHPWWYDQVSREYFSGGDLISNFDPDHPGEAEYAFVAPRVGTYQFWVRANPLNSGLSYSLNSATPVAIDLNREKQGEVNVAADGKADLRFLAWSKVGSVPLQQGTNTLRFRMAGGNSNHGYLDCFVLSTEPFRPQGLLKPDQVAAQSAPGSSAPGEWLAFDPGPDAFGSGSALDLRSLNEASAGDGGFITVKNGHFVHSASGEPVRFWAVNGPPADLGGEALKHCARMLAKRGVNLIRVHGGYFDSHGEVDSKRVEHALEIVDAFKAEGIYTHFSIYFPLWLQPGPDTPWLRGYDGKTHPFAALFFDRDFQAQYRKWWTAILTTPSPRTGRPLVDEPAVASLEMQNEDSLFFWTFTEQSLPEPELRQFETLFGDWLKKTYGSLTAAFARWQGLRVKRDAEAEGRVGFRPLWAMFNEKTPRDQDTAQFLFETQSAFYQETYAFLRHLGFKGCITPSNWTTASPEVFGPLEKLSYTCGDFLDRHGYFDCNCKGDASEWSLRVGQTYADRSALRFDAEVPGKPKEFLHPSMDPHYDGKPSMVSEITWNRPNRFRSESPLYLAAYGSLQDSDAIVQFALDSDHWAVQPGIFMQPWTLMTPAMMGQFPAAALLFRRTLIAPGDFVARVELNRGNLRELKGTPLPQDAALDALRLKDLPSGADAATGKRLDPLLHYAGRTEVQFTSTPGQVILPATRAVIDHERQTVTSTHGQLKLDYGKGLLVFDAPQAQGVSGLLQAGGKRWDTADLAISSEMELGHIVVVSLDDKPLATSARILLQVMSEEQASGFQTELVGQGVKRIVNVGTDPWLIRRIQGEVVFKRPDAASLKVTALDANGYPEGEAGNAQRIELRPGTLYYLVCRR